MRPQAETDGGVAARRAMDGGDNFDEADSQVQPVQLADPGSEAPGVAIPEGAGRIQDEARDELVRGMALANEVILGEVVARESSVDFNVVDGIRYMHSRGRATVDVHGVMKGRASVGERIEVEFQDNAESDRMWKGSQLLVLLEPFKGEVRRLVNPRDGRALRRSWRVEHDGIVRRTGDHIEAAAEQASLQFAGDIP